MHKPNAVFQPHQQSKISNLEVFNLLILFQRCRTWFMRNR